MQIKAKQIEKLGAFIDGDKTTRMYIENQFP